ncbi:MAG: uroporphyrinogen synthase, partial [Leptospiraceae bacterium]|nr:uroporphyrinogen synthase [Leptospiraceae bacterium]
HIDLAVHSYKDLDMQSHPDTEICSVLPRADRRDVLLIKKSALQNPPIESLLIYTSSPRRMYNLQRILPRLLPKRLRTARLTFEPMRGNIQTRLRKFMQADGHGFVLAKAALDRLLAPLFPESSNHPEAMSSYSEFRSLRAEIRAILRENEFMCLPLTENPCAPAQGALAVEFRKTDEGIRALVEWIQNATVEHSVRTERSVLAQYGGGCHQKIGVVHFAVGHDRQALVARGMSDAGEVIERTEIQLHADAQSKGGEADASEIRNMESGAPVERNTAPAKSFADNAEVGLLENDSAGALATTGRFAGLVAADLDVWVKLAEQDFWIHAGNELIIDEKRSA